MGEDDDSSTRSWDRVADDWIAHADRNDYRNHFLLPRMLSPVGDVSAKAAMRASSCGGKSRFFVGSGFGLTNDGPPEGGHYGEHRAKARRLHLSGPSR